MQIPGLSQFVSNIASLLVTTVETVLLVIVIILGIQFILNADNPQERSKLIKRIIWIMVGLFIVLSATSLTTFLNGIVNSGTFY
ncbi:MAG: TrbC/VirB2 family protein [Patescibacteria group bacterium]|jgi:type IV secretory pathway VirB2 component (pilin)